MKIFFSILAMVMVMFWCGSALALDTGACTDGRWGNYEGQTCVGLLEPSDMGSFLPALTTFGGQETFVWHQAFINELDPWAHSANPNWQNDWRPTKAAMQIDYARMDYRHYSDAPSDVQFIFQGSSNAVNAPWLWRVDGPNGEQTGTFFMYVDGNNMMWSPPEGCSANNDNGWWEAEMMASDCAIAYPDLSVPVFGVDPAEPWLAGAYWLDQENDQWYGWNPNTGSPKHDEIEAADINACCKMWVPPPPSQIQFYAISGVDVTAADVASIQWNGITVTSGLRDSYSDYMYLNYNTGPNVWQDTGWGEYTTRPEVYGAKFGPGIIPTELGDNDFLITLWDGPTALVTINVHNIEDMPTVAAKTYYMDLVADDKKGKKKRRKKIKATEQEVEVDNFTARELDGALVIQWAEPDGALTRPGMKLRMYIGDGWIVAQPRDTFLFLDCPAQIGTVVVPADIWSAFKTKMDDLGKTEVDIGGMYRFQNSGPRQYHNRGYLEAITFPIP